MLTALTKKIFKKCLTNPVFNAIIQVKKGKGKVNKMTRYTVKEHYRTGDNYERFTVDTKEKALEILTNWIGKLEEINGKFYGKQATCCSVRTYYTIEAI